MPKERPKNPHGPTVLIIMGATGDLVSKKIVPALFHLYFAGQLPKQFKIIGFARRPFTDETFQQRVKGILKDHRMETSAAKLKSFLRLFTYHQGQFGEISSYQSLEKILKALNTKWNTKSNRLFYFAVPPQNYEEILDNMVKAQLTGAKNHVQGWTRVLVEKPFGIDAKTSETLDQTLARLFDEDQIYRIDHYLAKEMLQGILAFRFSNNIFENIWNHKFIEKIDIRLWETLGVEHRGNFYDKIGALRDVGQNHLLQMLALVTMERPNSFSGDDVRVKRNDLLKFLQQMKLGEAKTNSFRAQYQGYRTIDGVDKKSHIETYFKIKAFLDSPRWSNVPITMDSGKRMGKALKEIVVTFRHPVPCLCPDNNHLQNRIVFQLEPEEHIKVQFWSKKPGLSFEIESRNFDFFLRDPGKRTQYIEEYIKLLKDSLNGDQTLFASTDEVKSMWRFTDPIIKAWQKNVVPIKTYQPDTYTIAETADRFIKLQETVGQQSREIAIVGLGKMGGNLARNLSRKGWKVVGYNRSIRNEHRPLAAEGITLTDSFNEMLSKLGPKKLVWLMLPAGQATDEALFGKTGLVKKLKRGDIIIDGANAFYKDTIRRAKLLSKHGIKFLDAGVSGGPSGALNGACTMVGGEPKVFKELEYLFQAMSLDNGYQFFKGAGAGHFVKMVHNGIEYGMMQAIAEGFSIMKKIKYDLDLKRVAEIYNHGSVIESRLTQWLSRAFQLHGTKLNKVSGKVAHTGEGAWTVQAAKELKLKAKIIEESLRFRKQSQKHPDFTGQVLSALREQFGGHSVN